MKEEQKIIIKKKLQKRIGLETLSMKILLIFVLTVYPLIYQINTLTSTAFIINKMALIVLVFFFIRFIWYKGIKYSNKIENTLFFISWIYIVCSLLFYTPTLGFANSLKEAGYSVIPFFLYFVVFSLSSDQKKHFIKITFYSLLFVIIIGLLAVFKILPNSPLFEGAKNTYNNFDSYYSPILMGYCAQFMFALTLFKSTFSKLANKFRMFFLLFFFLIAIITLQRAAYLGLLTSTGFYILGKLKNKEETSRKKILVFMIVILCFCFFILIYRETIKRIIEVYCPSKLGKLILDEFKDFNISKVLRQRNNQRIIYDKNGFTILFGEGFGKYSSSNNNPLIKAIDDASFYRIINELGLLGTFLFYIPFIALFLKAIVKKNFFAMYFIFQTIVAFFFNRILWLIPISYFIYPMFNFCMDDDLYMTKNCS